MQLSLFERLQRQGIHFASVVAPRRMGHWAALKFISPQRMSRPQFESDALASARRISLQDGFTAWCWGAGPKVFFVHGWEGRGSQFVHFIAPLVDAGFEVIAWDGPAHGDAPGTRTDPAQFSAALIRAQRELGSLHCVIAHSFGGLCSAYALRHGLDTRSVVLVATPFAPQDVFDRFTQSLNLSARARGYFQAKLESDSGVTAAEGCIDRLPHSQHRPLLIIHDRNDKEIPFGDAAKILASWPDSRLLATQGLGHRRILRSPDVIKEAVEFVRQQAQSIDRHERCA
jgi:pimeloyl-ACP methyl ester carboxylesterase